jgi:nucleotide-binding universal stress UspA family protein
MYRRILVALDGSAGSKKALERAVLLANEAQAPLHALAVEDHLPKYAATIDEVKEAQAERHAFFNEVMAEARNIAAEYEVDLKPEVTVGHAAQTICRRAGELRVDLLVIGHSGHSNVWGNFLGTTADKVSRHAPCDVLIVR